MRRRIVGLERSPFRRIIKFLRNTAISVMILLVISLVGGAIYTWYMGQNANLGSNAIADPVESKTTPVIKHAQPAANAKVGVSLQMITSPVTPGSNTSIIVRTNAEATCAIKVVYSEDEKKVSTDSGLAPKIADEYGMVSWSWTVEESVPLGEWPVTVTCVLGKQSGVYKADLVVARQAN
jgi:hypothetical protein